MPKIAAYGLSGDPITNGHRWVVEYGSTNFDKVYVMLATNSKKEYSFAPLERIAMCNALAHEFPNAEFVHVIDEFVVRKADSFGATVLLRGIRNDLDHHFEEGIRLFNDWLCPTIETRYIYAPAERFGKAFDNREFLNLKDGERILGFLSSSLVKGIVGLNGWEEIAREMVPDYVMPYLQMLSQRATTMPNTQAV